MSKLEALSSESLPESQSTPGITRYLAFKGENRQVLRSRTEPKTVSGWHHHGDHEVYGYVISGTARFENAADENDSITVGPGDFFHVPSHTVHREANPSTDQVNEVILFLYGSGPLVTNVDDPNQS